MGGGGNGKQNGSTSSQSSAVVDAQQKSIFGRKSEAETIFELKFLAMDPCRPQLARDNIRPLWNQILRIRKVMVLKDSQAPSRKRKLEQFVKDKVMPPSSGFASPNEPKKPKLSRVRKSSHVSSKSCLLNLDGSTLCQNEKNYSSSRALSRARKSSRVSSISCLLNSDGSTLCQNEKKCFSPHASCSVLTFDDDFKDTMALDSDESVKGSNQQSPNPNLNVEAGNEDQWLTSQTSEVTHRSIRLLNIQKNAIPIGPRFQVDVPDWAGPEESSILIGQYNSDPDNSKWLGTITWPIQSENMKATRKIIGKGRLASCSCASSGSVDCVARHVLEERMVLKSDLGPTFFSWKFDEMGGQVSKEWSLKEQHSFELVVRVRSSDNMKSFLKRVLKSFPGKEGKDIVNYYFNVYIPNRMSLHTRSPLMVRAVDTDNEDEEPGDLNRIGLQKKSGDSKGLKGKYLRGIP